MYLERFKSLSQLEQDAFSSFIGDAKGDFSKLTTE
jgi:hypothetical protein